MTAHQKFNILHNFYASYQALCVINTNSALAVSASEVFEITPLEYEVEKNVKRVIIKIERDLLF